MSVTWYPGHMKKARDEIKETAGKVDVIIEILDARLPYSSSNPVLNELDRGKPRIIILNKSDLADQVVTEQWLRFYNRKNIIPLAISATKKGDTIKIPQLCKKLSPETKYKYPHALVVGIPNVGKSTLINTLVGRKIAKTGDEPAITKHQQKVQIKSGKNSFTLSDTPGILWPEMENPEGALRLAASGAIKNTAIDFVEIACFAGEYLLKKYGNHLTSRFKLKELPEDGEALLDTVGRKRGCLKKGGIVDLYKAADIFLNELKGGKIGRISFETPDELLLKENE